MSGPFTYLSVWSGIEAAFVASKPIGWRPAAFAEIDPFACHMPAHHQRSARQIFIPRQRRRPISSGGASGWLRSRPSPGWPIQAVRTSPEL